jgi:hypothetical protein
MRDTCGVRVAMNFQDWEKAVNEKKAFAMDILKNKKVILIGALDGIQRSSEKT